MKTKMQRIDWNTGTLVDINNICLEIGQRVYGILGYGGSASGTFIVASEPDDHNNQLLVEVNGMHRFHYWTIGQNDKPISKKFGIGLYWDDQEPEYRMPISEVEKLIRECSIQKLWNHRRKINVEKARNNRKQNYKNKYQNILEEYNSKLDYQQTAKKNMLILLKQEFPGIKFSAKKEGYSYYKVSWVDGPTDEMVKNVCRKFVNTTFNSYEDIEENCGDEFTELFGGIGYMPNMNRTFSEDRKKEVTSKFYELHPEAINLKNEYDLFTPVYNSEFIYRYNSLTPCDCIRTYLSKQNYFVLPEEKINKKTIDNQSVNGIEIVEYSEKSIAVFGETKSIKDKLKAIGGRFNKFLSYKEKRRAGWIFPKSKQEDLKKMLGVSSQ